MDEFIYWVTTSPFCLEKVPTGTIVPAVVTKGSPLTSQTCPTSEGKWSDHAQLKPLCV